MYVYHDWRYWSISLAIRYISEHRCTSNTLTLWPNEYIITLDGLKQTQTDWPLSYPLLATGSRLEAWLGYLYWRQLGAWLGYIYWRRLRAWLGYLYWIRLGAWLGYLYWPRLGAWLGYLYWRRIVAWLGYRHNYHDQPSGAPTWGLPFQVINITTFKGRLLTPKTAHGKGHWNTYTHTHTYIHTYIHTCIHTYIWWSRWPNG